MLVFAKVAFCGARDHKVRKESVAGMTKIAKQGLTNIDIYVNVQF